MIPANYTNPYARMRMKGAMGSGLEGEQRMAPRYPMDEVPRPIEPLDNLDPAPAKTQDTDYLGEMQRIRGDNPLSQAYRAQVGNAPMSTDYQPTKMRRFGAALVGGLAGMQNAGAGVDAAQNVISAPYRTAVQDYNTKTTALGAGAGMEQEDIRGRIDDLQKAQAMGMSLAEYRQKVAYQNATTANAADRNQTEARRVTAYEQYVNNPDYQMVNELTGVRFVNKKNPRDTYFQPGETVASIQAKTQQGMLGVARQNANTNVRQANNADRRQTWAETIGNKEYGLHERNTANQEARTQKMPQGGTNKSASNQDAARNLALREVAADPQLSKFIDKTNPDFPELRSDLTAEQFQLLNEKIQQRRQEILSGSDYNPDFGGIDETEN